MRLTRHATFHHLAVLLLLAAATAGCRSSSRWASLNPWSKSSQDTSVMARTAPELPSESATNPGGAATSVASASGGEAPAFKPSEQTLATAPVASYPTTDTPNPQDNGAPDAYPTTTPNTASASPAPSSPLAAAPPAAGSVGPYDASDYAAPPASQTVSTGAQESAQESSDRYGATPSRYDMSESLPPNIPSAAPARGYASKGATDYRSTPSSTNPSTPPAGYASSAPADSLPSNSPTSAAGAAPEDYYASGAQPSPDTVAPPSEPPITTSPGGYRPGGTSDYAVSMASRTAPASSATPENGSTSTPRYPTAPLGAPDTDEGGAPSYPSTPSYR